MVSPKMKSDFGETRDHKNEAQRPDGAQIGFAEDFALGATCTELSELTEHKEGADEAQNHLGQQSLSNDGGELGVVAMEIECKISPDPTDADVFGIGGRRLQADRRRRRLKIGCED